jgi:predicted kinase
MSVRDMIIMRGLSGAGKSHTARELVNTRGGDPSTTIFSAVDYYDLHSLSIEETQGIRRFAHEAHEWCQNGVLQAAQLNQSLIVVDNTNIRLWEMMQYLEIAARHGYTVTIKHSRAPWRFDVRGCVINNDRRLDAEFIQHQLDRWEPWRTDHTYVDANRLFDDMRQASLMTRRVKNVD